jgi:hypothetical protein
MEGLLHKNRSWKEQLHLCRTWWDSRVLRHQTLRPLFSLESLTLCRHMSVMPLSALNSDGSSSHSEEQNDEGILIPIPEGSYEEILAELQKTLEHEKKHRTVYHSDKDKMALQKLTKLELDASKRCRLFLEGLDTQQEKELASFIGDFVTEQLLVRHFSNENQKKRLWAKNFSAIRMIVDGLENLIENKPFKTRSGKPLSPIRQAVFDELTAMNEWDKIKPSLKELRDSLKTKKGVKISKENLSKIVEDLGMRHLLSDGRLAASESGQRRREKSNVAIHTLH